MNFETGVISASSPSIGGVWAAAGPNQPAANTAASVRIAHRLIAALLAGAHPRLGSLHRPAPAIVSRRPRRLVPSRLEPALERPAALDLAERAPHARTQPRQVRCAQRRRLDHPRPQHG